MGARRDLVILDIDFFDHLESIVPPTARIVSMAEGVPNLQFWLPQGHTVVFTCGPPLHLPPESVVWDKRTV